MMTPSSPRSQPTATTALVRTEKRHEKDILTVDILGGQHLKQRSRVYSVQSHGNVLLAVLQQPQLRLAAPISYISW
jgi:predicted proteasome-type protease